MIRYSGNDVFDVSFNLYGYEDADFGQSAYELKEFVDIKTYAINARLGRLGLRMVKSEWYSPRYYNYQGDDVNIFIQVDDREKYIKYVTEHRDEIQVLLDKNKSYDGYTAMTIASVDDEISDAQNKIGFEPDIIVLSYALKDVIQQDDILETIVWDYDDDEEDP